MFKATSVIAITAISSVAFTSSAIAGEQMETNMERVSVEAMLDLEAPETETLLIRAEAKSDVLGAVSSGDLTAVEGPEGRIYYNRIIPISDLPDPELNIEVLETFEVEFEGDVYTNKIVQKLD